MALILAIEPDRRQAVRLTSLIRSRVGADLVLADTTEQALGAIGDRVPDLILTPALLAPQEDAALAAALRVIATAAHVQMLTIPVLAAASRRNQPRGFLAKLGLRAEPADASEGCDPEMFGEQIAAYLAEAAAQRADAETETARPLPGDISTETASVEPEPVLVPAIEPPAADPVVAPEADPVVEELPSFAYAMERTPVAVVEDLPIEELVAEEYVAAPVIEQAAADPVVEEMPAILYAIEETPAAVVEELESAEEELESAELAGEDLTAAIDAAIFSVSDDTEDAEPAVYELQADDLAMVDLPRDEIPPDDSEAIEIPVLDLCINRLDLWTVPSFGRQREFIRVAVEPSAADVPVEEERDDEAVSEDEPVSTDTGWFDEPAPAARVELWMPLSFGASRMWPSLDGVVAVARHETDREEAEAVFVPAAPAVVPAAPTVVPAAAQAAPSAALEPAPKPDWSELIASLRQDVQRLRSDRSHPAPAAVRRPETSPAPLASSPPKRPSAVADILARVRKSKPPAQDEWGLFDPEQCGFAALLAKLDEITHPNDERSG